MCLRAVHELSTIVEVARSAARRSTVCHLGESTHMRRHVSALAVVLASVLALGLLAGSPAQAVKGPPKERSGNAAYSWWTSPTFGRTASSFYFTGVNSQGYQRIYRWSRNSKRKLVMTYTNLRKGTVDDHNAPALSMASGKPSLVFYTDHPGTMYYRRAVAGKDPRLSKTSSSFGQAQRMPFDLRTTYAQVLRDGDRVVVLARYLEAGKSGWYYVRSSDSGATWSEPSELFDSESHQAYLLMRATESDASELHVMAYWHPKYGPDNVVGYRRLTFEQLWSGAAERFTVSGMQRVWASTPDGPANQQVRLLDGGDKRGRPMVFLATWDATNPVPTYRQVLQAEDGTWSSSIIRSAGGTYGAGNGSYVPGVTLDPRPGANRVFLGYRDGSRWRLAVSDLGPDGRASQAPRALVSSTRPLARPVVNGKDLMYQRLDKYLTFKNFQISVHTLQLR